MGYLFLLFIVSSVHCLVAGYEDKIRTRSYLHFLIFLTFCIFVYILLQPAQTFHLLPLLLIGVSILTGHFVVLTNSRASNVFFICALAGLILLFGFNVWDAFVDSLVQLLIDWGYLGLFISALLAGSIVPFSSELVMIALVKVGLSPVMCVLFATLGNTIGGMTCYYMGRLGNVVWIEKYFKVKKEKVDKMQTFLQGKGALMGFFAFLPFVGEVIAIALGFMRSNVWLTTSSMFAGKLIRYAVMLLALQGVISMF